MLIDHECRPETADTDFCRYSDTGWLHNAMDSVQQALAAYTGNDIWRDVIGRLPGYDPAATALLQPVSAVPVFVSDGIGYQWCSELDMWQAFDATVELGGAMTDPFVAGLAAVLGSGSSGRGRNTRKALRRLITSILPNRPSA